MFHSRESEGFIRAYDMAAPSSGCRAAGICYVTTLRHLLGRSTRAGSLGLASKASTAPVLPCPSSWSSRALLGGPIATVSHSRSVRDQMRGIMLCLSAAAVWCVAGELQPPEKQYKMLMLLPFSSHSHRSVFIPLAKALVDRGHKIDMLSPFPPQSKHPGIHEVSHDLPYVQPKNLNMFEKRESAGAGLGFFQDILPRLAKDLYKVPVVKELYDKRKEYDLILVDHIFNEVAYPFVHNATFITVATPGMDPRQSAVLGNVLSPSYVPSLIDSSSSSLSLWQRLQNTFKHIFVSFYWRNWAIVPLIQKEISAQFPDLPPLLEIERNQSLSLMNTHFSITTVVPLLPTQVEVGAMHCRPAKPLPKDLEAWISGAGKEGVIYFSLGSVTRGDTMPLKQRKKFIEAFGRLPQRVLWKFEGKLEDVPDNVMISKWLPQQDVLAHENVRMFISHGGLLSLQESIYHATPLLTLPLFGDQMRNAIFVYNSKLGRMLTWEELTADRIVEAVTDIITNTDYKTSISAMSSSLRDQYPSTQERAVFWTEYVIRHKGAPQLKCPATELSWVEFLLLDVLGLLLLALLLLLFLLRRLLRVVCAVFYGGGKRKME